MTPETPQQRDERLEIAIRNARFANSFMSGALCHLSAPDMRLLLDVIARSDSDAEAGMVTVRRRFVELLVKAASNMVTMVDPDECQELRAMLAAWEKEQKG